MSDKCVNINIIFESKLAVVKDILNDINYYVINYFPDILEDNLFEIRLIFSELLVNAVIHGNKKDPSKKVELVIKLKNDRILSLIRDEGNGFNYTQVLDDDDLSIDLMSGNGRGLKLVNSLADRLDFNNMGNEIEFDKKINVS